MAVEEGRTRIVSMLVKAGAALDNQNKVGYNYADFILCFGVVQTITGRSGWHANYTPECA